MKNTSGYVDLLAQDLGTQPQPRDGFERAFYTLWGRERPEDWIFEQIPREDFVGSLVEGTGRQDWRKLRPFDTLPEPALGSDAFERKPLYAGAAVRIAAERLIGSQPFFERAGDYQTIFFQFSGISVVETSFGVFQVCAGEALLIPAMVVHRSTGSPDCRRMVFYPKDPLTVTMFPEAETTDISYSTRLAGRPLEPQTAAVVPRVFAGGKVREHLTHWNGLSSDAYVFERSYAALVGTAEGGPRPVKVRPFNYFTTPPDSFELSVRTAMLWESPTFRQRVYAIPGRQPGPHRGYDEDEFWFQFSGLVHQESEHGAYTLQAGETSMAEAGITHTSTNTPGSLRLTTYANSPIRMVADPADHLRESCWEIHEHVARGWK